MVLMQLAHQVQEGDVVSVAGLNDEWKVGLSDGVWLSLSSLDGEVHRVYAVGAGEWVMVRLRDGLPAGDRDAFMCRNLYWS